LHGGHGALFARRDFEQLMCTGGGGMSDEDVIANLNDEWFTGNPCFGSQDRVPEATRLRLLYGDQRRAELRGELVEYAPILRGDDQRNLGNACLQQLFDLQSRDAARATVSGRYVLKWKIAV